MNNETTQELERIHLRILGTFAKWINVADRFFSLNPARLPDAMPTTVSLMFVKNPSGPQPLLLAPPADVETDAVVSHVKNPSSNQIRMAMFPTLSGLHKEKALTVQQKNLDGLIKGFESSTTLSPRQLQWLRGRFGHCAETNAWV